MKARLALGLAFLCAPLVANNFPQILDFHDNSVRNFLGRDITIVLSVNQDTESQITEKLKSLKEQFSKRSQKEKPKDGRLFLDDLQLLVVLDARKHLKRGVRQEARRIDGGGPLKGIIRRRTKKVGGPKKIAQKVREGWKTLRDTVRENTVGYLSPDRYRSAMLFAGADERCFSNNPRMVRL